MTSKPIIEVTVSPTGEVSVQTRGYAGSSCRQASAFLEKALGQVAKDRPTAEMYQAQVTRQRNTTRS
jgi:hypothetical protein